MRKVTSYIFTNSSVILSFDDSSFENLSKENGLYNRVVNELNKGLFDKIGEMCNLANKIKTYSNGQFYVLDGVCYIGANVLPDTLSKKLVAFAEADLPVEPLVNFWNNLAQNPSEDSKKELYAFLEKNHAPLTADGCFLGYKAVRSDFKDKYSGSFDNSVGKVCSVERSSVNPDRNQTCASGLHVAALDYAKNIYGNSSDVVVEVKVNPKDVVSVPPDYNEQKMRVCSYEVIRVCEGKAVTDEIYKFDSSYSTVKDAVVESEKKVDLTEVTKEDKETLLSPDDRGSIRIPKRFVDRIGAKIGGTVYVWTNGSEALITPKKYNWLVNSDQKVVATYLVDTKGNVRISQSVLSRLNLELENVAVTFDNVDKLLELEVA